MAVSPRGRVAQAVAWQNRVFSCANRRFVVAGEGRPGLCPGPAGASGPQTPFIRIRCLCEPRSNKIGVWGRHAEGVLRTTAPAGPGQSLALLLGETHALSASRPRRLASVARDWPSRRRHRGPARPACSARSSRHHRASKTIRCPHQARQFRRAAYHRQTRRGCGFRLGASRTPKTISPPSSKWRWRCAASLAASEGRKAAVTDYLVHLFRVWETVNAKYETDIAAGYAARAARLTPMA